MPTQQYIDYANEFTTRREREKQLIERYSQKPEPVLKRGLWMHSIDRHESSSELSWIAGTLLVLTAIIIFVLFRCA